MVPRTSRSLITTEDKTMARAPIHPGKFLEDELGEIGISARKLADAIDVPSNRLSEIIRGRRGITVETALVGD